MSGWRTVAEELMRDRASRLVGYGVILTGSVPDAEDLLHDAIVKSFSRGRRFDHVNVAESYVRGAMQTLAVDRGRTLAARRRAVARSHEPEPAPHDSDATLDVEAALRRLSDRERVCVVMRFFDDLRIAEIAERLSLAEGTVKRYLSNASSKLAGILGASMDWERERGRIPVADHKEG